MSRIKGKASSASALLVGVALTLGLLLVGAQLVLAQPTKRDFTVTPQAPLAGQTVTFNATGLRPNDSVSWDFENDGRPDATGTTVQHVYATSGQRTVRMRVTRPGDETVEVLKTVTVGASTQPPPPPPNQPPVASLTASPNPATVGQTVQLNAAGSSDPDGTIVSYAWDLDNDGQFDDGSAATASRSFAAPGSYTVGLRVTDNRGSAATATTVITVTSALVPPPAAPPNVPPVASFTVSPRLPLAGDTVQLVSTSSDPDGSLAGHGWDLDNDGQFDDSASRTPVVRPGVPGSYPISLRVTDANGAADITSRTIVVGPRVGAVVPALELMRPFPVVRIVGRSTGSGARIRLLAVRSAPSGAKVTVRCRGRGCRRLRPRTKYVRSSSVRFRSFERRLPAGVRIQLFVTQPGRVGKYTSFKIRRTRPARRTDLCVTSVSAKPEPCPTS